MSIKSINDSFMKLRESDIETIEDGEIEAITEPMYNEFSECADLAQDILKKSVAEKDLVVLMLAIQKAIVASKNADGGGATLFMADLAGDLQSYTHTVILTTIGVLIQDEIL